jgi:hypothetical protein
MKLEYETHEFLCGGSTKKIETVLFGFGVNHVSVIVEHIRVTSPPPNQIKFKLIMSHLHWPQPFFLSTSLMVRNFTLKMNERMSEIRTPALHV